MLSQYEAVGIAEGFVEAESEEQVLEVPGYVRIKQTAREYPGEMVYALGRSGGMIFCKHPHPMCWPATKTFHASELESIKGWQNK